MLSVVSEAQALAVIGLAGGLVLGLAARHGRFCTLGAIEDLIYGHSALRARMWLMAIGVAVVSSHALIGGGYLDPLDTAYLGAGWNPAGAAIGGLVFGYGMALAGNCGYGTLARLGGGDLRAFVVLLVMAVAAYMTMSGPFATLRVALFPVDEVDIPRSLSFDAGRLSGVSPILAGIVVGLGLIVAALVRCPRKGRRKGMLWAAAVGLAITWGWAGTAWVAREGFDVVSVQSYSFAGPLGDSLLWLMTSSGTPIGFSVGATAGVLLGALIGSVRRGHFRWEACEDPRELRRQIAGGFLMGVGGVTAVGCSVGQGLTAFSLLAYSAPVTLAAIVAGAALGLRQLILGGYPAE